MNAEEEIPLANQNEAVSQVKLGRIETGPCKALVGSDVNERGRDWRNCCSQGVFVLETCFPTDPPVLLRVSVVGIVVGGPGDAAKQG